MPGSLMSSSRMSGADAAIISSAASPLSAVSTAKPTACSSDSSGLTV